MTTLTAPIASVDRRASRVSRRSYDIFDTLIARRCIRAVEVFSIMEERIGVAGFAQARIEAERVVQANAYTLGDIYAELRTALNVDDATAQQLMQLEVQVELENVLPIAEHLDDLPQDAILLTDMYLPVDVIRELLRTAGLRRDLPVLIHSHGKSSGMLWRDLARRGMQCSHLGDNERSDVVNARAAGMRARLSTISLPTALEQALCDAGAVGAAQALRAARLRVRRHDLPDWLIRLQTELNIPYLLVCALDLLGKTQLADADEVLFASRDGRNLQSAFEAVRDSFEAPANVRSRYWYTSRVARTGRSPSYLAYCDSLFVDGVVVADLCGTGASLSKLFKDMGRTAETSPLVYLGQKVDDRHYAEQMARRYGLGSTAGFAPVQHTFENADFINNALLEQLNYVPEGMVRDVEMLPYGALPIRDGNDFDDDTLRLIEGQHRFLNDYFQALQAELRPAEAHELIAAVPQIFAWLHQHVRTLSAELKSLQSHLGVDDSANEIHTLQQLGG